MKPGNCGDKNPAPEKGRPGLWLILLAAADYLVFWALVFYFPRVMFFVSLLLIPLVLYLRKNQALLAGSLENLKLAPPSEEWLIRWMHSWVLTALLGCGFAGYLGFGF